METRIQKWGNSLGVRIPKSFAEEVDIEAGSSVDISVQGRELVVRRLRRRGYVLEDLLRAVRPDNLHEPIDWGGRVGREVW